MSNRIQRTAQEEAPLTLRQRLIPQGENLMNWASYAVIFVVLVTLILDRDTIGSALRFYGAVLAISAILVINIFWVDLQVRLPTRTPGDWIVIGSGALLTLGAAWLTGHTATLYLLLMIAAQAFATRPFVHGLLFVLTLCAVYLGIMRMLGASPQMLAGLSLGMLVGVAFVATLAVLLKRNTEQTELAQGLAADLQAANNALIAAHQREQMLAAAEERVRLAREIHDGLGHHLTVLNVQLQAAAKLIEQDPRKVVEIIAICRAEAQAALEEVRRSVAVMRHTPLDGRSLEEALRALVAEFDDHAPLTAHFEMLGSARPCGPAVSMTLYRAAQEGLTNAQKHAAGATQVRVTLAYAEPGITLSVEDDGTHPASDALSGGFGLAGLRERAEQLGGSLETGPGPQGGFRLALSIPLKEEGR